ncbi:MAG: hypothetical protein QNJ97_18900 [Myxococcota bacterium]|nr:hypothetical protein [Myxococcota bacterium]
MTPPSGSFNVPTAAVAWTPVTIGSGRGRELRQALVDKHPLALMLENSASALLEDRVFQMVKAAGPEIQVVTRGRARLDAILEELGEIPYRVTLAPAGTNILGQPVFIPKEHPLYTEWLKNKKPLKGAKAMLTVRPIAVDDIRLKQLRQGRQGSCEAIERGLKQGLEAGAQFFNPYETEANKALANGFTRHLDAAFPKWSAEIAESRDPEWRRCMSAYQSFLNTYAPCLEGACKAGPKVHITAGGIIGMEKSDLLIPKTCPVPGMRDYVAEMEDLAARAVAEVLPALDRGWVGEIMRHGGLETLSAGITEVCTPRHRRFNPDDLNRAQSDVRYFLSDLQKRTLSGEWLAAAGMERVPGLGPVRVIARINALGHPPTATASQLVKQLRALDRCDEARERLYQAILIDVATSEVVFMGIFFEAELLCDGLPPG